MSIIKRIPVYYTDEDGFYDLYCKSENCEACFGTNPEGEPNGYGCEDRDEYDGDGNNHLLENSSNTQWVELKDYRQLEDNAEEAVKFLLADIKKHFDTHGDCFSGEDLHILYKMKLVEKLTGKTYEQLKEDV